MEEVVHFSPGLFIQDEGGGRLVGDKCLSCGRIFFPKAAFCWDCLSKDMKEIPLSRKGTLYSYTIGRLPSSHFQPPYAVGLIDLPEGPRVFAPLEMTQSESYRIGMEMELYIAELWEEEDRKIIGYKFRAVA